MKYFILIILIAATFYTGLQKAESVARKHAENIETLTLSHREEIAKLRRQYEDQIKGLNAQLDDHTHALEDADREARALIEARDKALAEAAKPAAPAAPAAAAPPVPGVVKAPTGPPPAIRKAALTLSLEKATRELKEWKKKAEAEEAAWENKTGIRQSDHDRQLRRDQVKAAIATKQAEVDQIKSTLAGLQ